MRGPWGIALAALIFLGAQCRAAYPSSWSANEATADQFVAKFLQRKKDAAPPALSVAVGLNGELLVAKGYGEARPGQAADAETVYHIGSLTKQFTAAAILALLDRKATALYSTTTLTLDTELQKVFAGVEHWTGDDAKPISLRRLLTMTSNLPNFTRRPPAAGDPWGAIPASQLLGEVKKFAPRGWPNTFEYSNTSYFLLAEIIEAVSVPGASGPNGYKEVLKSALFAKAGMTSTGFIGDDARGRAASPHYQRRPAFLQPDWMKGSGDVASTVLDIHAWNTALMQDRVLSPAMRRHMFSDGGRVGPSLWYGMGWFVEHKKDRDEFTHAGTVPGYTSFNAIMRRTDDGSWASVTLLANSDGIEGLDELASDLGDRALAR